MIYNIWFKYQLIIVCFTGTGLWNGIATRWSRFRRRWKVTGKDPCWRLRPMSVRLPLSSASKPCTFLTAQSSAWPALGKPAMVYGACTWNVLGIVWGIFSLTMSSSLRVGKLSMSNPLRWRELLGTLSRSSGASLERWGVRTNYYISAKSLTFIDELLILFAMCWKQLNFCSSYSFILQCWAQFTTELGVSSSTVGLHKVSDLQIRGPPIPFSTQRLKAKGHLLPHPDLLLRALRVPPELPNELLDPFPTPLRTMTDDERAENYEKYFPRGLIDVMKPEWFFSSLL